jgi:hypothetical protein
MDRGLTSVCPALGAMMHNKLAEFPIMSIFGHNRVTTTTVVE